MSLWILIVTFTMTYSFFVWIFLLSSLISMTMALSLPVTIILLMSTILSMDIILPVCIMGIILSVRIWFLRFSFVTLLAMVMNWNLLMNGGGLNFYTFALTVLTMDILIITRWIVLGWSRNKFGWNWNHTFYWTCRHSFGISAWFPFNRTSSHWIILTSPIRVSLHCWTQVYNSSLINSFHIHIFHRHIFHTPIRFASLASMLQFISMNDDTSLLFFSCIFLLTNSDIFN